MAGKSKSGGKNGKGKKKALNKRLVVAIVIIAVLCGAYMFSLSYEDKIDDALGLRKVEIYQKGDLVTIGSMNIHFLDVGQGDSCLIELPDDRTVLIDAGENNSKVKAKLSEYIADVNDAREDSNRPVIDYFDFVIATHSDSDHIGSLDYILESYPAAVFYRPNEAATNGDFSDPALSGKNARNKFRQDGHGEKDTATYKWAIEAGYRNHSRFIEGIVTNPFDSTQNCIKPDSNARADLYYELNFYGPVGAVYGDHNNYSPIIIAEYQGRRVALSGDCEKEGERDFVAEVSAAESPASRYYRLKDNAFYADIIKCGHHGSGTSGSADYLNIMTKNKGADIYAIISCGKNNTHLHPHKEALDRLADAGITSEHILRTDEIGDIFFTLVLYKGLDGKKLDKAYIEDSRADAIIEVSYKEIMGIEIKYSLIAPLIIIIIALIILPLSVIKKEAKAATKRKK